MLKSINLLNYRNLSLKKNFNSRITLISGKNGSGKTNFLSGIYYLSNGFALKGSDHENLAFNQNNFFIEGDFELSNQNNSILKKTIQFSEQGKNLLLNDKKTILKNFGLSTKSIIFTPESIELITSSPAQRRDELDKFCIIYNNASEIYREFESNLRNRNSTLKSLYSKINYLEEVRSNKLYTFWTEKFINSSVNIISLRLKAIEDLESIMQNNAELFHFSPNKISISYISKIEDLKNYRVLLQEKLSGNILKEVLNKSTLYGPHRDDFSINLNGMSIRINGSRGQQRMTSFILKYSEFQLVSHINPESAQNSIFLLDDLPSELDQIHIENIEKLILNSDFQVFLTATSPNFFSKTILDNSELIEL